MQEYEEIVQSADKQMRDGADFGKMLRFGEL